MNIAIRRLETEPPDKQPVEIVERKGKGHPDTICDALAEHFSRALSEFYLEHTDHILHHNVDKVLLAAGASQPRLGGGRIVEPMRIFLGGRATSTAGSTPVPVADLANESARAWLRENLHALDVDRHIEVSSLVRPGSTDLVDVFERHEGAAPLANDTSCGVGFAPLTELERLVLAVETELNRGEVKRDHVALGEDVKVMGVRRHDEVELTVGCAMVDTHLHSVEAYRTAKATVASLAEATADRYTDRPISVRVNHADNYEADELYLTVTGTSAENGDDGQAGRGNRVGGLITPYRPMVLEAAAGKNPMNHVGKLYNVLAPQIAQALVEEIDGVTGAQCILVSRIGEPIDQPQIVDVQVHTPADNVDDLHDDIAHLVAQRLRGVKDLWRSLLKGEVRLY